MLHASWCEPKKRLHGFTDLGRFGLCMLWCLGLALTTPLPIHEERNCHVHQKAANDGGEDVSYVPSDDETQERKGGHQNWGGVLNPSESEHAPPKHDVEHGKR